MSDKSPGESGTAAGRKGGVRTASMQEMDDYSFAAEVAAGQLCVDQNTTLDGLLCDPRLAARFDELAATFAPGFTSFQYRWAALTLRKRAKTAKKLAQTRFQDWLTARLPRAEPPARCDRDQYECPGVYILGGTAKRPLYVGETLNLRRRIAAVAQTPAWSRLHLERVTVIPQAKQPFGLQAAPGATPAAGDELATPDSRNGRNDNGVKRGEATMPVRKILIAAAWARPCSWPATSGGPRRPTRRRPPPPRPRPRCRPFSRRSSARSSATRCRWSSGSSIAIGACHP